MGSIASLAARIGYDDLKRLGTRTALTCGVFTLANTLAPLFFEKYPMREGYAFAMTQAVMFSLLFDNKKIENWTEEVKRNHSSEPRLQTTVNVARFFFMSVVPILAAKLMVSWVGRGITWRGTTWISSYNYVAGIIGLYAYKSYTTDS